MLGAAPAFFEMRKRRLQWDRTDLTFGNAAGVIALAFWFSTFPASVVSMMEFKLDSTCQGCCGLSLLLILSLNLDKSSSFMVFEVHVVVVPCLFGRRNLEDTEVQSSLALPCAESEHRIEPQHATASGECAFYAATDKIPVVAQPQLLGWGSCPDPEMPKSAGVRVSLRNPCIHKESDPGIRLGLSLTLWMAMG